MRTLFEIIVRVFGAAAIAIGTAAIAIGVSVRIIQSLISFGYHYVGPFAIIFVPILFMSWRFEKWKERRAQRKDEEERIAFAKAMREYDETTKRVDRLLREVRESR